MRHAAGASELSHQKVCIKEKDDEGDFSKCAQECFGGCCHDLDLGCRMKAVSQKVQRQELMTLGKDACGPPTGCRRSLLRQAHLPKHECIVKSRFVNCIVTTRSAAVTCAHVHFQNQRIVVGLKVAQLGNKF